MFKEILMESGGYTTKDFRKNRSTAVGVLQDIAGAKDWDENYKTYKPTVQDLEVAIKNVKSEFAPFLAKLKKAKTLKEFASVVKTHKGN